MSTSDIKLILSIPTDSKLATEFFDFLYRSFDLEYFEFEGKKYCQKSTPWYTTKDYVRPEFLKECNLKTNNETDYFDENCDYEEPQVEYGHIDYFFRYHDFYEHDEPDEYRNEMIDRINDFINNGNSFLDIEFVNEREINLKNSDGINKDRRGADNTDIILPFYHFQDLGCIFTMNDLLTSIFKIKSHKFDFNYEMFFDVEVIETNSVTRLNVSFDHGS